MGRSHTIQTNFTSGELSPTLRGREDLTKFFNGSEKLENFIVKPQGGAFRRSGTQFIAQTKDSDIDAATDSTDAARLVEFEFSTTQAYILEFGDSYMRVYRNGGIVVETATTITGVTQADPAVVTTSASHGYSNGDHVYISGIVGMVELNGRRFTVANQTATTFELTGEDSSGHTAYSSAGSAEKVYEVATPWATADLDDLQFAQSADVLYVVHPDYEPRKITRTAHTTWTISTFDAENGPYLELNSGDTILSLSFEAGTITGITQANPAVVTTSAAHDLTDGDIVKILDVVGMTEVNDRTFVVANKTATTFELTGEDSTGHTAWSSGGTVEMSGAKDRATAVADGFDFSDPADVDEFIEYIDGDGYWGLGKVLEVDSTTEATIEPMYVVDRSVGDYNFVQSGGTSSVSSPYSGTFNTDDARRFARVRKGGTSGHIWRYVAQVDLSDSSSADTFQYPAGASAYTDANTGEPFVANYVADGTHSATIKDRSITAILRGTSATFASTDVGRWVRLNFGTSWVDCEITSYTSTTEVGVSVSVNTPIPKDIQGTYKYMNDAKTAFWRLGAWSDTTGWPTALTFHQQRLWFAGTTDNPDTLWSSKVDDYANFQPTDPDGTVLDDSAITATIASNQVNAIKWMASGPVLLAGTLSAEYQIRAASTINEPLTPTNIDIKTQTTEGTKESHTPQRIGNAVLFIQRAGRKVYDLRYSFEADSFVSRDLNITSEHILRDQTKGTRLRYQKNPNSILWVLTDGGELLSLTYEADQEVFAWSRQIIAGTNAVVESIAVIPSQSGTEDELWMIVKREVNGTDVRYVERMLPEYNPTSTTDKAEMKYVDSMISGDATSTTVYGLSHLEGEELQVVVDGDYIGDKTVSSHTITLAETGTIAVAGLGFTSKIKTMPSSPRGDWGSAAGGRKQIPKALIQVLNSIGVKYGRTEDDLFQVDFRVIDADTDESPELFTGWKKLEFPPVDDREGQYWVEQEQPLPLNVLNLVTNVEVSE